MGAFINTGIFIHICKTGNCLYRYQTICTNQQLWIKFPSAPLSKMCCAGFMHDECISRDKVQQLESLLLVTHAKGTTGAAGDRVYLGLLLLSHMQHLWDSTTLSTRDANLWGSSLPITLPHLPRAALILSDTESSAAGVDLPHGCTFTPIPSGASTCSKHTLQRWKELILPQHILPSYVCTIPWEFSFG